MHPVGLEGSSGRLWGSWWVLGMVLWGAQAVPGTFAGDLKSTDKNQVLYGILALWGALCAIESFLSVQEETWVSFGMSFGPL